MRKINVKRIKDAVEKLCIKANTVLRKDIEKALKKAVSAEKNKKAKHILKILLENAGIAKNEKIAICQDTGLCVAYIELGEGVKITGGGLKKAVGRGIENGYKKGYFRKSVVKNPITRQGLGYDPEVIYVDIVKGGKIKITVSPKGFGSENKSRIKMLNPTDSSEEIKSFVLDTVKNAGADACPPFVLGIGIGGTFDKAALLAKKALFLPIDKMNKKAYLRKLEKEILDGINKLNIGPMGLGGKVTALGVNILDAPTHIAGLPVAVNISCHATRSASITL